MKSVTKKSAEAISERDAQINQFGETIKSLSANLRSAQEAHAKEKEKHKNQVIIHADSFLLIGCFT